MDYTSADGIMVLNQSQTAVGLKTYKITTNGASSVQDIAVFEWDPGDASPAAAQGLGFSFKMSDSANNQDEVATFEVVMDDETTTSEDASIVLNTVAVGTVRKVAAFGLLDTAVDIVPAAVTHSATVNVYNLLVRSGGAQTIPAGTTAVVATARFDEPNITATGTVTDAATVWISGAPTEAGTRNNALLVDSGSSQFDGTVTVGINDVGHDVKFFGDTAGKSMLWDTSADKLIITGDVSVSGTATGFGSGAFTENVTVADTYGLVVGGTAQQTISDGGGATDVVPEVQVLGTATADMTALIGGWSTTATRAAAPTLALLKSGNATIASHTVVTDGEILGSIIAYGDDGTDYESPAAAIEFAVDGTPGTGDMPGEIKFYTTADSGETLTLALTLSAAQAATFAGAVGVASLACTAGATFGGGYGDTGATISTAGVIQADGAITSGGAVTGTTLAGTISTATQNSITSASSLATVGTITSGTWSGVIDGSCTMTLGSDATGDIYYRDASGFLEKLAASTDGHVLTSTGAGSIPAWEAIPAGSSAFSADVTVADGYGLVVGGTAQQEISDGDGSTGVTPEAQILGTATADMTALIGGWSTTATRAAAPTLALLKSGNATIASHTVVTDDEILGSIIAYGDDGTDYESPAAAIEFAVDGTPGTGDMPGSIEFYTTVDEGETLTSAMKLHSNGSITKPRNPAFRVYQAVAQNNCTGDGSWPVIEWGTEVLDAGGDVSGTTFTAPAAGLYAFNVRINAAGVVSGHTAGMAYMVSSQGNFPLGGSIPSFVNVQDTETMFEGSQFIPLDAGDTVIIKLYVGGGTKVIDVAASAGNHWEGFLVG